MTRGMPRAEAERMVVRGFFQNMLDRIELEPVRETVAMISRPGIESACAVSESSRLRFSW